MRPGGAARRRWPATLRRAQTWRARATQLTAAVNAVLRRPDGTYVDGVDAERRAERPRLPGGQRTGARLRRRAGLRPHRGRSVRREPRHRRRAQPRARASARARGGGHARGHGAHADRHVHSGLGPHRAAGGTFTWEVWKPSDLIGDSMSHGWGSSALVAMQETLLGRDPRGARRRRHGPRGRGTAVGRPRPRRGFGADGRRPCACVLAAARARA